MLGLLYFQRTLPRSGMLRKLYTINPNKYAVAFEHQLWTNPSFVRFCSKESSSKYGKQLGGYEYKEEIEGFRSKWRVPFMEREGFWFSKFDLFGNKAFPANLTKYNPANFKLMSFKKWWNKHAKERLVFDQKFVKERLFILGCDLAAAHFVVYRGGAVKFHNHTNWIRDDKKKKREYDVDLPNVFKPEYVLEAIDFSGTVILFEGLKNIENLKTLKWLSFAGCRFFNNWCLDRVSGYHGENLEYLDISHTNVSYHGLNALYRFKKLKTLKVDDMSEDPEFMIMCLAMKKCLPELIVEGISFDKLEDEHEAKNVLLKAQG